METLRISNTISISEKIIDQLNKIEENSEIKYKLLFRIIIIRDALKYILQEDEILEIIENIILTLNKIKRYIMKKDKNNDLEKFIFLKKINDDYKKLIILLDCNITYLSILMPENKLKNIINDIKKEDKNIAMKGLDITSIGEQAKIDKISIDNEDNFWNNISDIVKTHTSRDIDMDVIGKTAIDSEFTIKEVTKTSSENNEIEERIVSIFNEINISNITSSLSNDIKIIKEKLEKYVINPENEKNISTSYIKYNVLQKIVPRIENIICIFNKIEKGTVNLNFVDDIISFYTVYDFLFIDFIKCENSRIISPTISITTNTIEVIKVLYNVINKLCLEIKILNNETYCKNISLIDLTSLFVMIIINKKHEIFEKTNEWALLKKYIKQCISNQDKDILKEWIENYLELVKNYWKDYFTEEDDKIFNILSCIIKDLYLNPYAFR